MVLPEGFGLPPIGYTVGLVAALGVVGYGLWRERPPLTEETVVGLVPWMVLGGGLHVLWVIDAVPTIVRPLLGTPAVYGSTAVLAVGVWLLGLTRGWGADATARGLGLAGGIGVAMLAVLLLRGGVSSHPPTLAWIGGGLLASLALTAVCWSLLDRARPAVTDTTGWAGVVVLFGHALDGVTTAIGMDVFGTGERSPIPQLIAEFAASLPTAELVGVGWLFVLVKLGVAVVVVVLFREYVAEAPRQGYGFLAALAAVGLGPGTHNFLLFLAAG